MMDAKKAALLLAGPTQRVYFTAPVSLVKAVEEKVKKDGLTRNEATRMMFVFYATGDIELAKLIAESRS